MEVFVVWHVENHPDRFSEIDGVFATLELARTYVEEQKARECQQSTSGFPWNHYRISDQCVEGLNQRETND